MVSKTSIIGPHWFRGPKETTHWDLGFKKTMVYHDEDTLLEESKKKVIENTPISYRIPDLLLILGDAASQPKFQESLIQALENMELFDPCEEWESNQVNPLYVAARGAAEIAKVWQGSEWNCKQMPSCSDERPEDDGEGVSTLR